MTFFVTHRNAHQLLYVEQDCIFDSVSLKPEKCLIYFRESYRIEIKKIVSSLGPDIQTKTHRYNNNNNNNNVLVLAVFGSV